MAIVVKAFILCATDDPLAAEEAVFGALNGAAFESANPVLDFATGVEQIVAVDDDYIDGSFTRMVPAARFLSTANPVNLPC